MNGYSVNCLNVDIADVLTLDFEGVNDWLLKPTFPNNPNAADFLKTETELFQSARDYARMSKNDKDFSIDEQMVGFSSFLFDRGVVLTLYRVNLLRRLI
jgi:hypothetical protein